MTSLQAASPIGRDLKRALSDADVKGIRLVSRRCMKVVPSALSVTRRVPTTTRIGRSGGCFQVQVPAKAHEVFTFDLNRLLRGVSSMDSHRYMPQSKGHNPAPQGTSCLAMNLMGFSHGGRETWERVETLA